MEELVFSKLKNDELLTEVLYKIEPNFFKALDIVSQITETREMHKIIERIRKRGWVGDIEKFVSRVDVKDPAEFKRKIMAEVQDVPLTRKGYYLGRSFLSFCVRQSDKTQ